MFLDFLLEAVDALFDFVDILVFVVLFDVFGTLLDVTGLVFVGGGGDVMLWAFLLIQLADLWKVLLLF